MVLVYRCNQRNPALVKEIMNKAGSPGRIYANPVGWRIDIQPGEPAWLNSRVKIRVRIRVRVRILGLLWGIMNQVGSPGGLTQLDIGSRLVGAWKWPTDRPISRGATSLKITHTRQQEIPNPLSVWKNNSNKIRPADLPLSQIKFCAADFVHYFGTVILEIFVSPCCCLCYNIYHAMSRLVLLTSLNSQQHWHIFSTSSIRLSQTSLSNCTLSTEMMHKNRSRHRNGASN